MDDSSEASLFGEKYETANCIRRVVCLRGDRDRGNPELKGTQVFVAADNERVAKTAVRGSRQLQYCHLWAGLTSARAVDASRSVIRFILIDSEIQVANIGIRVSPTASLISIGQRNPSFCR